MGAVFLGVGFVCFSVIPYTAQAFSFDSVIPSFFRGSVREVPPQSQATSTDVVRAPQKKVAMRGVCLQLDSSAKGIEKRSASGIKNYRSDLDVRERKILADLAAAHNAADAARKETDHKLDAHIAALLAKAKTEGDRQAIQEYASSIKAARVARRSAVDAARRTYIASLSEALSERKVLVENIANELSQAMSSSLNSAKASCEAGKDPKDVRSELRASLEKTQVSYEAKLKDRSVLEAKLQVLAKERDAAILAANEIFAEALREASQKAPFMVH